jgi:hypothetical protein
VVDSAIVVNPSMSEKKMVSSARRAPRWASAPSWMSSRTSSVGTYLLNERRPLFMALRVSAMRTISWKRERISTEPSSRSSRTLAMLASSTAMGCTMRLLSHSPMTATMSVMAPAMSNKTRIAAHSASATLAAEMSTPTRHSRVPSLANTGAYPESHVPHLSV